MKWVKKTSTNQIASGKMGSFCIHKSRDLWWANYIPADGSGRKTFKMPPRDTLREIKELCEDNVYWEEEA